MSVEPAHQQEGNRGSARPRAVPAGGAVAGALALVAVAFGLVGVHQQLSQHAGARQDVWEVLFRVLQLFALEWDEPGQALPLPWPLQIARFLAPTVTVYAAVEAGRRLFADELRQLRVSRQHGHAIVCGSGPGARSLARDLTASGQRVVIVSEDASQPAARSADALVIVGDPRFPTALAAAGLAGATALYACDEDSTRNLAVALTAAGAVTSEGLRVQAEIRDPLLCRALQARWWSGSETRRVRLDFFNRYQVAAARLLQEEAAHLSDGKPREVLVVGQSSFARAFITCLGRFGVDPASLTITVVGESSEQTVEDLVRTYPYLVDTCTLRHAHATCAEAVRQSVGRGAVARVYLCASEQDQVIRQALLDTDLWRASPEKVTVCMDDVIGYGEALQRSGMMTAPVDDMGGRLKLWSVKAAAYRLDAVGEDFTEMMSRAVHEAYVRRQVRERAAGVETSGTFVAWDELSEDLRNANRNQVLSYGQKLAELGCVLMPRDGQAAPFSLDDDVEERLAQAEHLRWMNDRLRAGWSYAQVRDDSALHHPNLVPWSELSEADREKDREVVRGMGAVLADAGFDVVRVTDTESPVVVPGSGG
ncbi:RyR domain-containing protein [Streptomyces sp. NPDC001020]